MITEITCIRCACIKSLHGPEVAKVIIILFAIVSNRFFLHTFLFLASLERTKEEREKKYPWQRILTRKEGDFFDFLFSAGNFLFSEG